MNERIWLSSPHMGGTEMKYVQGAFDVDHSTIQRWVIHYTPLLEQKFRLKKRKPCSRWRFDETYIKVKGEWKY